MADATTTAAPAKKRRAPQGPRTPRPVFAIVTYQDTDGSVMQLDRGRLSIKFERDSNALVELLTGGGSLNASAVVRVELPAPTPRKKAEAPAS